MLDARLEAQRHVFGPLFPLVALAHLSRVLAAQPDEMRLSRQASLQGALTSKRWCVAVWGFRLVGSPSRERRAWLRGMLYSQGPGRRLAERRLLDCALLQWRSRLQIAEQALQPALVGVMVFPAGEISNMARLFDVCSPISGALDDPFIQADGKEHGALCFAFFGQCFLYLVFDPPTSDRMRREDQQQLIVLANGLIDALSDLVSNLHIFRGKPAAYACALQVGIQPVGKLLVTAGIANKAGVILNGMGNQGAHIGEEVLLHNGVTQKCFGNVSPGEVDRINTDTRWAFMLYRLKSSHGAQIDTSELCPPDSSIAEVGVAEVGTAKIGTAEVGTAEVSTAEGGTAEVGIAEVGIAEVGIGEVGMVEVGIGEVGIGEVGTSEGGFAEVGLAEVGLSEGGFAEVGLAKVGLAEVGTAEVRLCCWMLLYPRIPNIPSLSEYVELVLICHVDYLLCSALIIERCGYDCKHFSFCFSSGDASPLVLLVQCPCSLGHDTGKPCLSKYITACLSLW